MLELVCKVYNINEGHNKELLSKCKWLSDYMVFVDKVRECHKGHDVEELHQDIESAIDYCIKNNILSEFFEERRTEVLDVTAVDYRYERRMELNYNEGKEDGLREGKEDGLREGKIEGKLETIRALMKNLKMSAEQAMESAGIPKSDYNKYLTLL